MLGNQHPLDYQQPNQLDRRQVVSPREREQPQGLQANALQDRPNVFDQANAQVVMQRQRQEVRQQEMPGGRAVHHPGYRDIAPICMMIFLQEHTLWKSCSHHQFV